MIPTTRSLGPVLFALAAVVPVAHGQNSMPAVAPDALVSGEVLVLTSGGELLRHGRSSIPVRSDLAGATAVATDRETGMLAVTTFDTGPRGVTGELLLFDEIAGEPKRIRLVEGFWPQAVALSAGRIAVGGSHPQHGLGLMYLKAHHPDPPSTDPPSIVWLGSPCGELGIVSATGAPDSENVWIASLEECGEDGGYQVYRVTPSGGVFLAVRGHVPPLPSSGARVVVPALKTIVVTDAYLCAVLNRVDAGGTVIDLWTHEGEFLGRSSIDGLLAGGIGASREGGDTVRFVDLASLDVAVVSLARIAKTLR